MSTQGWLAISIVILTVILLAATRVAPDMLLIGAVTALLTLGILEPAEAISGLSSEATVTVGVLFLVAAGVRETGALDMVSRHVLGQARTVASAQARLLFSIAGASAFLNNTPIVAMMLPVVIDWCKKHKLSVSKLLLPLSYATILGGTCTLIGTSTNLVVYGLLVKAYPETGLGLLDLAWVGVPCAVVGIIYILVASPWLLPERRPVMSALADPREYTVEMLVEPSSPLVGRTIEEAGLRHLSGMYLMEIHREGEVLAAVASDMRLHGGDRVVFVGVVESVVDLQRIRGLVPATDQVFKLDAPRAERCLIEAVVSSTCPLVGRTIRDGRFRAVYNAAVIAVARSGQRVRKKIGDIVLQAGDTLLLEAHPAFVGQNRNSRDFYLVSAVEDSTPPQHDRAWVALAILAAMVLSVSLEWLSMLNAGLLAAGLLLLTRCITAGTARRSVDWEVLLVTAAAFGISRALEKTGAAVWVSRSVIELSGQSPWGALAALYAVTMVFNAFMSNNAAAALMFPIALATARALDVNILPFAIGIMMAGSNDFATPFGYQTNLMVYGPGGYRFGDYLRLGGPLNLLVGAVAVLLIPVVWPF